MPRLPEDVTAAIAEYLGDLFEVDDDDDDIVISVTPRGDIKITIKNSPIVENDDDGDEDDVTSDDDDDEE